MQKALIAIWLLMPFAYAADADWARVTSLAPDQRVKVYLTDGTVLKGRVERTAEGLALRTSKDLLPLAEDRVSRVSKKSRGRGAMWGGIIGFAVGAPVGAAAGPYLADWGNPSASKRLQFAAGWGLYIGGISAGIGWLTGAEQTIFKRQ
jgi:hypothetical protein